MNSLFKRQLNRNKEIDLLQSKIYCLNSKNRIFKFMMLDNLLNLVTFHFNNNDINFINNSNCFGSEETVVQDFRDSEHFKTNFLNKAKKNNLILINIYMDSTNFSKNKKKKKDVLCVYLTFVNDTLQKMNKRIIYNLACISCDIIREIGLQTFLKFIFEKIKNELEGKKNFKIKENTFAVKIFIFHILGDNLEIYSILNNKVCFGRGSHSCRVCDVNTKNYSNLIENYEKYIIRDNEIYNHEINQIKINKKNSKFYICNGLVPEVFLLKKIDILGTFPLDLQHVEAEGEIIRSIIIFFYFYEEDFLKSIYLKNLLQYIEKINKIEKQNIVYFLNNLCANTNKILEKNKNNFLENEDNEENENIEENNEDIEINEIEKNNLNENEENNENIEIEENNEDIEINEIEKNNLNENEENNEDIEIEENEQNNENCKKKKKKRAVISSGEAMLLLNLIPVFFYEYIDKNITKLNVKNLLLHYKMMSILTQKKFIPDDFEYLDYLVKERISNLLKMKVKLVTKTFLQIHYSFYIKLTGPLRETWCFPFENHHLQIKKDIALCSKNIGITAFKNNFKFFCINYEMKLQKIIFENNDYIEYKILKLDKTNIIDTNFCVKLEKNLKVGKIKKIFLMKRINEIVFEVEIKKIEKEELDLFFFIKEETNTITKIIPLKQIKVFFKINKLEYLNKQVLINKIFVN
jgi:hypothetical protein